MPQDYEFTSRYGSLFWDGGAADRGRRRPRPPADIRWKEAAA